MLRVDPRRPFSEHFIKDDVFRPPQQLGRTCVVNCRGEFKEWHENGGCSRRWARHSAVIIALQRSETERRKVSEGNALGALNKEQGVILESRDTESLRMFSTKRSRS